MARPYEADLQELIIKGIFGGNSTGISLIYYLCFKFITLNNMTNREVKELFAHAGKLLNYFIEREEKNFKLLYGLNRNYDNLEREDKLIDKTAKQQLPELFEIESKAMELGRVENEKIIKENSDLAEREKDQEKKTEPKKLLTLNDAMQLLTEEERTKHSELMKEYEKILDQKNEFEVYKLKLDDIADIKVDFQAVRLLSKFMYE